MDREVRHLRTMELRHQRPADAADGRKRVHSRVQSAAYRWSHRCRQRKSIFFCIASLRLVVDRRSIKRRRKKYSVGRGLCGSVGRRGKKGCPGRRGSRCVLTDVSAGQAEGIAILRVVKRRQLVALRFHRLGRRGDRRRQPGPEWPPAARRVPSRSGCPAPSRRRSALPDSS